MSATTAAEPAVPALGIGHNQGPPLEGGVGWTHYAWRRAHRRLWRAPGREVLRRRVERAAELGLSYRQYVSVLLDRGVRLEALVLMPAALSGRPAALAKLSRLANCRLLLPLRAGGGAAAEALAARLRAAGRGVAVDWRETAAGAAPAEAVRALLAAGRLPPSAAALIGAGAAERQLAATCGLGLFMDADRYFGQP